MAKEKRLIDANALWEEVEKSQQHNPHVDGRVKLNHRQEHDHFLRMIYLAPTVDAVEVVHGYWIDSYSADHLGRIIEHSIDCSVCDSVFKDDSRAVVQHWKKNFKGCPFCGAVMDGGNEDG